MYVAHDDLSRFTLKLLRLSISFIESIISSTQYLVLPFFIYTKTLTIYTPKLKLTFDIVHDVLISAKFRIYYTQKGGLKWDPVCCPFACVCLLSIFESEHFCELIPIKFNVFSHFSPLQRSNRGLFD